MESALCNLRCSATLAALAERAVGPLLPSTGTSYRELAYCLHTTHLPTIKPEIMYGPTGSEVPLSRLGFAGGMGR